MFDEIKTCLLTKYKENDFLTGGCYIYAKLVAEKYGGDVYINKLMEHCAVMYRGVLYDVKGKIKNAEEFHLIKPHEEVIYQKEYRLKGKAFKEFYIEYRKERS